MKTAEQTVREAYKARNGNCIGGYPDIEAAAKILTQARRLAEGRTNAESFVDAVLDILEDHAADIDYQEQAGREADEARADLAALYPEALA